jgi:hypothetical protein
MARRAQRERVTVAELLDRSAAAHDRSAVEDTLVLSRARHRKKPQVLRSLARVRVFSVVAGALALTGGIATAVSMPVQRSAGATWPPVGLEPPAVALVPLPADVVLPPARSTPESVAPPGTPREISPAVVASPSNSGSSPGHRGTLAKAVKIIGKDKAPNRAAPVRHEVPEVPSWSRGRPGGQEPQAPSYGRRHAGQHSGGHHGCGGGGRHRR